LEKWPKLQVALDLIELDDAFGIAEASVKGGADILEAGTPMIKSLGMEAVKALRKRFPSVDVLADLKTLDAGWLETELAAKAGATTISISALAYDATVLEAIRCAKTYGVEVAADLLGVRNVVGRALRLEQMGINIVYVHTPIDIKKNLGIRKTREKVVMKLAENLKIPVAVAGGLNKETAPLMVEAGARIVVVGSAITKAEDPREATALIVNAINTVPRSLKGETP